MYKFFTISLMMISMLSTLRAQFGSTIPASQACNIGAEAAIADIKQGAIRLLIVGGIAPKIYGNEDKFEQDYLLKYHDYGCMAPSPMVCLAAYNKEVFKYLDATYGHKWREDVREDVVGLKDHIMPFAKIFGN